VGRFALVVLPSTAATDVASRVHERQPFSAKQFGKPNNAFG
jgi:hypothetical protein